MNIINEHHDFNFYSYYDYNDYTDESDGAIPDEVQALIEFLADPD
jgi:hypothetical protein